jgi:hypothetical protein
VTCIWKSKCSALFNAFNACCSVHLGNKGDYLFQLNVQLSNVLGKFLLFAQHVSDITASIIRSTYLLTYSMEQSSS